MKRTVFTTVIAIFSLVVLPAVGMAGPDRFIGDSVIYTGEATKIRPKILLIIDNSNATLDTASGEQYDPNTDYSVYGTYSRYAIYAASQQGTYDDTKEIGPENPANMDYITCNNNNSVAKTTLASTGTYVGQATNDYPNLKKGSGGSANQAVCDTTGQGASYALGNFLNYTLKPPPAVLVVGTDGNDYKLKVSHTSAADNRPISGANWSTYWQANGTTGQGDVWASGNPYSMGSDTQRKVMYDAVTTVLNGARFAANFGAMIYDDTGNKGGKIQYQVTNLTQDATFNAFKATLPGPGAGDGPAVLSSQTSRPQAESLLDAGYYFRGQALPISGGAAMTSPLQYECEKGYVILLTNGLSNKDNDPKLGTMVGDFDNDGIDETQYGAGSHYLDDVAKFLYDTDASASLTGTQRIVTHTVLAFQAYDLLVDRASNGGHGHGSFHNVYSAQELAAALLQIINSIVLEANTSFAAPVVPVSPENKTYSGSRLYMGFFKPQSEGTWRGNLKKLGLNSSLEVVDKNGAIATSSTDGSILSSSVSYWGSSADGGNVDQGGVGALLLSLTDANRKIYTYTGSSTSLTNSSNAFTTSNGAITNATLDVADATAKDKLVNFVRGLDAYDDDGDSNTTEKRSWVLGDILHSKPLVVSYAGYTFTSTNEADCNVNKSMIYVGANDGMLHAFKDCDGSEAWAFIPQDLLPILQYLRETGHPYFVDGTPVPYIYDANNNGTIESGDKVILIFGERRGGGKDVAPTGGFYYALDVTDPAAPVYMWRLSNTVSPSGTNTDYSELAETWSDPKIGKIKIGTANKIAAFIGAGYDNLNEDSRYGATQTFPSSPSVNPGTGTVTSSGTSSPSNPKGRGIYVVEVAALNDAGVPSFTNSGHKIWGYTNADSSTMAFSVPGQMSAQDTDYNNLIDRLYVGDTGGNIWRFSIGDSSTSNWTATKIFASNPGSGGSGDTGRKIFYRPSVTFEVGYKMVFFGTGDREHPLNRNVLDRMYAVKDTGQVSAKTETDLTDVTTDTLQASSDAATIASTLANLNTSAGWYIQLNEHSGEKVLAEPYVLNRVAYYTTHTPNVSENPDPCSGNLGTGRIYALNYKTGEAVINYDTTNDGSTPSNTRALDSSGNALLRSDRVKTLGSGIPSGVVGVLSASGDAAILVGIGSGVAAPEAKTGGGVIPIYWRQK